MVFTWFPIWLKTFSKVFTFSDFSNVPLNICFEIWSRNIIFISNFFLKQLNIFWSVDREKFAYLVLLLNQKNLHVTLRWKPWFSRAFYLLLGIPLLLGSHLLLRNPYCIRAYFCSLASRVTVCRSEGNNLPTK